MAPPRHAGGGSGYRDSYSSDDYALTSKPASSNRTLLKVLSVVFALGFLAFALGLGGTIYLNRQTGDLIDESIRTQREYYQNAEKEGWMTADEAAKGIREIEKSSKQIRRTAARILAPRLRGDVIGSLRATVETLGDYDLSDYTAEEKETVRKNVEQQKERMEEQIRSMSAEELKDQREDLLEDNKENIEKVGIRYVWLIIGGYGTILMIIGGALALIALIAWFILGGLRGSLSETTVLPAVIACIVVGIIMIVVCGLCISTITSKEMN